MDEDPRMEVFSLKLEHVKATDDDIWVFDEGLIDPQDPFEIDLNLCRIFINDGQSMREIYNPVKLKDFYTDLPPGGFPPQKRAKVHSNKNIIDLPVITDHYEDVIYHGYFHLIVHQGTDDDLLNKRTNRLYMTGSDARPEVYSFGCTGTEFHLYDFDKPTKLTFVGQLFRLTLDCIVFGKSRVVTVTMKWLLKDNKEGDGVDEKKKHDLICGGIYFRFGGFESRIVLFDTPVGKAVEVVLDKPIQLLRSVIAIPYPSTFTVEADLYDPITNFYVVRDSATFETPAGPCILPKLPRKLLNGNGLDNGVKLEVEVTVNNPPVMFWALHSDSDSD